MKSKVARHSPLGIAANSLLALLMFSFVIGVNASQGAETPVYRQVSKLTLNWDGHPGVQLAFDSDVKRVGDPGDFHRVRISVPGHKTFTFVSSDAWIRTTNKDARVGRDVLKSKRVASSYVLGMDRGGGHTSLILFLTPYGCCTGGIDVLELTPNGTPVSVLHREQFELQEIADLDGDGIPELAGLSSLGEELGTCMTSYAPRYVFHLGAVAGMPGTLSLPLSRSYNLKHYYGWAGPKYSATDHVIVLHPKGGGKPVITDVANAEKLTDPSQCKPTCCTVH